MPAVGKTALALNIANSYLDRFPDSQLYIDCFGYTAGHEPLKETEILDTLLSSLEIPISRIPNTFSEKNILWHSILSDKKMIVIFDNIKSTMQIEKLIPQNGESFILITSRNNLFNLVDAYPITIDVLDESSAVQLLYNVSEKSGDEYLPLFRKVAKKCGYLPLALQIIARRMRGRRYLKFVERFVNSNSSINPLSVEENQVFDSFDLSYTLLDDFSQSVLAVMGICPCIEITPEICAMLLGENVQNTGMALDLLYEQHLIEEIGDDRYRLHDLMRDFARMKYLKKNEVDYKDVVVNFIKILIDKINNKIILLYPNEYIFNAMEELDAVKSNVQENNKSLIEWLNSELNNFISCLEYLDKQRLGSIYIQLLYAIGPHIRRRLPSDTVIKYGKIALSYAEKINSAAFLGLCDTYLGLAYEQSGNFFVAIDFFIKAETIWKNSHNINALAYVLSNKGFTLERLGDYPNSLEVLEEALVKYREKRNTYGEGFVLNAIGAVNWRMKKYSEAKTIFIQALELRKEIGDKIGISSTTNNLGFTYLMMDDEKNAIINFEYSLKISDSFGDLHGKSVTINNIGYYFIYKKDYPKAIEQSLLARELALQVGNDYQVGRSYDVEAKAQIGLLDMSNAKNSLEKAIEIFRMINVPELYEDIDLLKNL